MNDHQNSSADSDGARRRERVAMAREICMHRGENPDKIDRGGIADWEKYEPLAGAVIREAERLFAMRAPAQAEPERGSPEWFCQWLSGYLNCITERDELDAFEANSIRSELARVFPLPAATVETKSAPEGSAPHNSGERLSSSDAADTGADTHLSANEVISQTPI